MSEPLWLKILGHVALALLLLTIIRAIYGLI
jgi:hypothetical protein